MSRTVSLLSTLILLSSVLVAQPDDDSLRVSYGVFGGANLNIHTSDFRALPGIPNCCPRFETATGLGFAAGAFVDMPLSESFLLAIRTGLYSTGLTQRTTEQTSIIAGNESLDGEFEHTLKSTLLSLMFQPLLGFTASPSWRFYIGAHAGYRIVSRYEQLETITKPTNRGTFKDTGLRTRNDRSGDIPNLMSFSVGPVIGTRVDLPLTGDQTVFLSPQIFASANILPVVRSIDWRDNWIHAGIGITFSPAPDEPPPLPVDTVPTPPPPPPPPELIADIFAFGLNEEANETPNPNVRVEEFLGSTVHPLLPYVFFDENEASLPSRYQRLTAVQTGDFSIKNLPALSTLPMYYHVLNIIGQRLRDNPSAKLTITGCNSDEGVERKNTALSTRRAETVRDYLQTVWGVKRTRMDIKVRNLPVMNSTTLEPDGIAENRRVELASDDWEVMKPVSLTDTFRVSSRSDIRFRPQVRAESGIAAWKLDVRFADSLVHSVEGTDVIPASLTWDMTDLTRHLYEHPDNLRYLLSVTDAAGQTVTTDLKELTIDRVTIQRKRLERIADKYIERFALILFDFDKSDIRGANERILQTIKEAIKPASGVRITGYTDRIGDSAHNRLLSERRAVEVKNRLEARTITAEGVGEEQLLFNNDLPEGRTYSRTVIIDVETPVGYEEGF